MVRQKTRITFLGTGPSSSVPNLYCLSYGGCKNCIGGKNNRTNVSIMLYKSKPLLIDCTKDFKEQYEGYLLKEIKRKSIRGEFNNKTKSGNDLYNKNGDVDTTKWVYTKCNIVQDVLLTHLHADAITGLDTLEKTIPNDKDCNIFTNRDTAHYLVENYRHLFKKDVKNPCSSARLKLNIIEAQKECTISDYKVVPYYVKHGGTYSYMFLIDNRILYVSDCSEFNINITAEVLIIECTTMKEFANGHINFEDVLEVIDMVSPRVTYLFGMSHHIDYDELKAHVETLDKNIIVAFDLMEVEV